MSLLVSETKAPVRPSLAEMAAPAMPVSPTEEAVNVRSRILYLRSYLLMRAIIGFLGVSLPVLLIVGDNVLSDREGVSVRGALSAYYYSGMRDFLVASLAAIGVFLLAYKVFERSLNNVLSLVSGLAALTVALFPTSRPGGVDVGLTPVQERFGEQTVAHVHYTAAGIFIVSLAIISFFFGLQEGRRSAQRVGRRAAMSPTFWRWFHWVNAAAILVAVVFMVLTRQENMFSGYSLLVGQVVAIVAFGLSWLAKGLELDVLLGPGPARRRWQREREAAAQNP